MLNIFLSTGKPVALIFYDGKKFEFTQDASQPGEGKMFYVIRTANRNVTVANLEAELLYGVVNSDYIASLQLLLQRIYYPLVEN